ncbi:alpha/beta fold hydrolase [Nocardia sp. R6R-6]|uniref:alpha/beta fold hydrolase n=1 Tax=Nocardia sp. R6R-6 TaxID=3459303 RepID=UPI00403E14D3
MAVAYYELGSGPIALCIHGFPDTPHTWRHLMPRLADAGFRVVAPYLRGYNADLPPDGGYQVGALVSDAIALHEALGGDGDAVIIGSDMGALATYGAIDLAPERWRRAVTMAAAPHGVLADAFLDYDMIRRIYYIFMLQTDTADVILERDPFGWLESIWNYFSAGYDATADIDYLRATLAKKENLWAATRGIFKARLNPAYHLPKYAREQAAGDGPFQVPIRYLHGTEDGVFPARLAKAADGALGGQSEVVFLDGVGHFLHLEAPEVVNDLVVDWISRGSA